MRGRGGGSVTAGRGGGSLTAGRRAADRELPPLTAARPARRPRSAPLPGLLEAGPGADSRLQSGAARRPRGTRRRSAPRGLPGSFPVSSGRGGGRWGGGREVRVSFASVRPGGVRLEGWGWLHVGVFCHTSGCWPGAVVVCRPSPPPHKSCFGNCPSVAFSVPFLSSDVMVEPRGSQPDPLLSSEAKTRCCPLLCAV